jgi:predicted DNA-binding ribbon-helix-helix protein
MFYTHEVIWAIMNITSHIHVSLNSSLKVLQSNGQRISIRLEDIFWEQLEKLAENEHLTLSKFVHALVHPLDPKLNRTAFLRCYCLRKLQETLSLSKADSSNGADLGSIITACPTPVFVLGNDRRIVAYNPGFKNDFLSIDFSTADGADRPPLKLTFSQPFNTIKKFLIENPGRVATAQVGFSQGGKQKQNWVRFALADKSRGDDSLVIAFVGNK